MRADAQSRRRRVLELYAEDVGVDEIVARTGLARTTVWRHLRVAGVPKVQAARATAPVQLLPRAPWWRLRAKGPSNPLGEIVLGRKYCSGCGRWRQLCDFPRETRRLRRGLPAARCWACSRITSRYYDHRLDAERRADRRERHRIYYEGQRRAAGVPRAKTPREPVAEREYVFLERTPLARALQEWADDLAELERRSGVPTRAIYRVLHESGASVSLDIADRLAQALGSHLSLLYGPDAKVWRGRPPYLSREEVNA